MARVLDKTILTNEETHNLPFQVCSAIQSLLDDIPIEEWDAYNKQYVVRITVDEIVN